MHETRTRTDHATLFLPTPCPGRVRWKKVYYPHRRLVEHDSKAVQTLVTGLAGRSSTFLKESALGKGGPCKFLLFYICRNVKPVR